ncbi:MAG: MerR family transcriptional regulator [Cellulosilyticum sp.]|nr:MerR family transcriptional regulator [Cellulosilyticum sp.]
MYTIQQLASISHVPPSTLRYYEEIGLLENVERNPQNQRIYNDRHIERLKGIHRFKRTGMSISKIHEFYKYASNLDQNIDAILNLVKEHEADIKEKINSMEMDLIHIKEKVLYYSAIKKAIEEDAPWPSWNDINE